MTGHCRNIFPNPFRGRVFLFQTFLKSHQRLLVVPHRLGILAQGVIRPAQVVVVNRHRRVVFPVGLEGTREGIAFLYSNCVVRPAQVVAVSFHFIVIFPVGLEVAKYPIAGYSPKAISV